MSSSGDGEGFTTSSTPTISLMTFVLSNKINAILYALRIATILLCVSFFLPVFGVTGPIIAFQRVMICGVATSTLKLHQRISSTGGLQLNRQSFERLVVEDSCHYLIFGVLFIVSSHITIALCPVVVFAILHASDYTRQLLSLRVPCSAPAFLLNFCLYIANKQRNILRFVAINEIMLMLAIIFSVCISHCSIVVPFVYYKFLCLRYASLRNPYSRTVFYEMRMGLQVLCDKPLCPRLVKAIVNRFVGMICRMAPANAPGNMAPPPTD